MYSVNNGEQPIVEPKSEGDVPDLTRAALHQRVRQQEILAELGVIALQGASFNELLTDTVRLTAEGLRAEFCKVLEHIPSENRFLVRAGVGWSAGIIGVASVGADLASPAGFALRTGKPVISNHLENEERFRTSEILQQHGIRRAMNVILQGEGRPSESWRSTANRKTSSWNMTSRSCRALPTFLAWRSSVIVTSGVSRPHGAPPISPEGDEPQSEK